MARKATTYWSLRHRNLTTKLKHHLILHYEFARKSRLAEDLIDRVVRALEQDEPTRGVIRVKPWQCVFRRNDRVALLTLFNDDDRERLQNGEAMQTVRSDIERRLLAELRIVWPEATLGDLRTLTNVRRGSRKGRTTQRPRPTLKLLAPNEPPPPPPRLADVQQFAKGVTKREPSSTEAVVSPAVSEGLCRQLVQDYNLPPKLAPLIVQDIASVRAQCLPRLQELRHGQVLVLSLDCHSRIGEVSAVQQPRLQPVIVTLFTEAERQALYAPDLTFREARQVQLHQFVRVCIEAYAQEGLLALLDLECLFLTAHHDVGKVINEYEQTEQILVPTPGTVLDAGNKVTHKALVVRLYLDGLTTTEIARKLYHSEVAVDNYIGTFDKVALLHLYGVTRQHMRFLTGRSRALIDQYLRLVNVYFKDRDAVRTYLHSRGVLVA